MYYYNFLIFTTGRARFHCQSYFWDSLSVRGRQKIKSKERKVGFQSAPVIPISPSFQGVELNESPNWSRADQRMKISHSGQVIFTL